MGKKRRSSRPDLVRLRPWVLGSGSFALAFAALQLFGARARLPSAEQVAVLVLMLLAAVLAWRALRRGRAPAARGAVARNRREFEARLADAFQAQGYQIVPTGAGGPVDLVLRRDRGNFLVHSRGWQADKIGVEVLRDLQAAVVTRGASGGFVVCQGRFSREAQRFAAGSTLRLIDAAALRLLLQDGPARPA
ncbi:MAG: restriction endonuclease [Piscinibacter sp.]|nr:restriction endonuclease [Piscinibacter sp.]